MEMAVVAIAFQFLAQFLATVSSFMGITFTPRKCILFYADIYWCSLGMLFLDINGDKVPPRVSQASTPTYCKHCCLFVRVVYQDFTCISVITCMHRYKLFIYTTCTIMRRSEAWNVSAM